MDDIRAYSMALDASQVSDLYNATIVTPAVDPSISIALPASQVYGQAFVQTLDLQGASEYSVSWQAYDISSSSWVTINDVNADKMVPYQYQLSDVRALLVIGEQSYESNTISVPEFLLTYEFVTDVASASLGDTITIEVDKKGYSDAINFARLSHYANMNFDDYQTFDLTYVGQVGDIVTYQFVLSANLHQRFLFPSIQLDDSRRIW